MFSHIMVGADDLDGAKRFYDAVLGTLGVRPGHVDTEKGRIFWAAPTGMFGVTRPINGEASSHANGGTIGFAAASPEQVDQWHAAGVAHGGTACEDPPGVREVGGNKLHLAYLRDPAGNKLCAMHRIP